MKLFILIVLVLSPTLYAKESSSEGVLDGLVKEIHGLENKIQNIEKDIRAGLNEGKEKAEEGLKATEEKSKNIITKTIAELADELKALEKKLRKMVKDREAKK